MIINNDLSLYIYIYIYIVLESMQKKMEAYKSFNKTDSNPIVNSYFEMCNM